MNTLRALIVPIIAPFAISCNDTSTGNGSLSSGGFNLRITVKNPDGSPIPGLRVSAWNIGPRNDDAIRTRQSRVARIESSTAVMFEAPSVARVLLSVYDLDHTEVSRLVDRRFVAPGISGTITS